MSFMSLYREHPRKNVTDFGLCSLVYVWFSQKYLGELKKKRFFSSTKSLEQTAWGGKPILDPPHSIVYTLHKPDQPSSAISTPG